MKKIFFVIFAVITLTACSNDDGLSYHYELLAAEDAFLPDEFDYGSVYDLTVKYIVPDQCYVASDLLYEYDDTARNIAVISLVADANSCEPLEVEQELTIRVHALQTSPYVFRFWQGEDENGEPIYLVKEVPVNVNSDHSAYEFETTHTEM